MTQDATRRSGTLRATVVLTSLALGLFSTASSPAAKRASPFSTHTFQFRLEGSQAVPAVNNTDGSGWCTITLDDQTGAYSVVGGYTCLRGDVPDIHLHGPAPVGQDGAIITQIPNSGGTSGTFSRNGTLASQLVQDMVNGLIYVQLHSSFRTGGELRGQVVPCSAASVSARPPERPQALRGWTIARTVLEAIAPGTAALACAWLSIVIPAGGAASAAAATTTSSSAQADPAREQLRARARVGAGCRNLRRSQFMSRSPGRARHPAAADGSAAARAGLPGGRGVAPRRVRDRSGCRTR